MPITSDSIQYGPFKGGVRYDLPAEEVGPSELNAMENVRIAEAGQLEQRPGSSSYQSASALTGGPTVTMAFEFEKDENTTYVLIAAGDKLYYYNSGWSDITGSVTITAGNDNTFEACNANGTFIMCNGVDAAPIKWTGTGDAADLDVNSRFTKAKHCTWFDNRLWFANVDGEADRLFYSDTADIETWAATSYYDFGGRITGLVPTQNALIVHTTIGLYTLIATGSATLPYKPNSQTTEAGLDGRSCVALPDDTQFMLMKDGVYKWAGGAQLEKVSYALDGADYWDNINTDRLTQAFAIHWQQDHEIWWCWQHGAGQVNPNHIMVYDYAFDHWEGPFTGVERNCGGIVDNKPHLGCFSGYLWDHDSTDDNDGGAAIVAYAETGALAPYGPDTKVRWIKARHFYEGQLKSYDLSIFQYSQDIAGDVHHMDLRGAGFVLDVDKLDQGRLGEMRQNVQDIPLVDFAPTTGFLFRMNGAYNPWMYYKCIAQYKPLGRYYKPEPRDSYDG